MLTKKTALGLIAVATLVVVLIFSFLGSPNQSFACLACGGDNGVVDKAQCEAFTVKITFKNTGTTEGKWSVNIAFEGESWTWSGTSQTLTLKPSKTRTLTWNGSVPCNAPISSVARLIAYYNDSFTRLDWWIQVISNAELAITSSSVE